MERRTEWPIKTARAVRARGERVDRLALPRDARDRRARTYDRGGRGRRRHLQPDHLPEGARRGRVVRRAAARGRRERDDPTEIFFALAEEDIRDACDLLGPVFERTGGIDGYVSLEVDPTLAYDRDATFDQAIRFHEGSTARTLRQDPGHEARARRDRGLHREGAVDQRHVDLLPRALHGGRRGVHPRARAARRVRRRPGTVLSVASFFVSRVDTEADKRLEASAAATCGKARGRERKARVPALAADVLGRSLGVPRRQGRTPAEMPVGLHVDEEPGLPRRHLRRGAGRAGHRQHDAARDGQAFQDHGEVRDTLAAGSTRRRPARRTRRGGCRLRRHRRDAGGRGRPEVRRLLRRASPGIEAKLGAVAAGVQVANPLARGPRLRRRPDPCVVVIFGASGDLTKRSFPRPLLPRVPGAPAGALRGRRRCALGADERAVSSTR